jgi:Glycosyl hydrolases family 18
MSLGNSFASQSSYDATCLTADRDCRASSSVDRFCRNVWSNLAMSNGAKSGASAVLLGYFPSSAIHAQNNAVSDIPADRLTHVIYAFAQLNSDGTCVSVDANDDGINFPQLQNLKQQHPNLQTLISVGGDHAQSTTAPPLAAPPASSALTVSGFAAARCATR